MRVLFLFFAACSCAFPWPADPSLPFASPWPCSVSLFKTPFESYDAVPFSYSPPTSSEHDCFAQGPRVSLVVECSVTAGRQFDRSLYIQLGGAAVFFGTTSEPTNTTGPSWKTETELSDYISLLKKPLSGSAQLGTIVNSEYNGVPSCSATLVFFPGMNYVAPDVVIPIGLSSSSSFLQGNLGVVPDNLSRAVVHVQAQGQQDDEFFWSCAPDYLAKPLQTCGATAIRNILISIDNVPAALFPAYPYIFTGGIDPSLWNPIPGVQTLHLLPQKIPLSVGLLTPQRNLSFSLSIGPSSNSFWVVSASVFLYLDDNIHSRRLVLNSLPRASLNPVVTDELQVNGTRVVGILSMDQRVQYTQASYVVFSNGTRVQTNFLVHSSISNVQWVNNSASFSYVTYNMLSEWNFTSQVIVQSSCSSSSEALEIVRLSFPLRIDSAQLNWPTNSNMTNITTIVRQGYFSKRESSSSSMPMLDSTLSNVVFSQDTMVANTTGGSFSIVAHANSSSNQTYSYKDSSASCYQKTVASKGNQLTSIDVICNSLSPNVNPFYGYLSDLELVGTTSNARSVSQSVFEPSSRSSNISFPKPQQQKKRHHRQRRFLFQKLV